MTLTILRSLGENFAVHLSVRIDLPFFFLASLRLWVVGGRVSEVKQH